MGWTALLDENDNEIGVVGDSGWDLALKFLLDLTEIYKKEVGRVPTQDEVISTVEFVLGEI